MTQLAELQSVTQGTPEFDALLARLARRGESDLDRVEPAVREILGAVRSEGDAALTRYVERFEKRALPKAWVQRDYGGEAALASLPAPVREALVEAAARIRRYHQRQADGLGGFEYTEQGVTLGSRVTPLARVGVYAPGGKARYPSSVLMCAVPAQVAGVTEIIVACPDTSPEVRAARQMAGRASTRSSAPATSTSPPPSAWCSARSTSTASRVRAKSWWSPTTAPTRC